jgi:MoaA/NifB/PqqE/SkfB family radical SAM enzyme
MSLFRNFIKTDRHCRKKFIVNMVWKGLLGFRKFKKRKKRGELFPAFQFISVTNNCNLKCQGCWVSSNVITEDLDVVKIHKVIDESKKKGSYFFGILGGEPLMYDKLFDIFEQHADCYFQLFTNGTLFNESVANRLRKAANVTPLFSFEGDEYSADIRRGGNNIFNQSLKAIDTSAQNGLITGVAISVCKSNIEMALSDEFITLLHNHGVLYVWYYIYRPAGENPNYDLALSKADILRLRQFLVDGRIKYPVIIIDSYWRANGEPFCPAAEGLSHHINASGDIEPCPVVQVACDNIADGSLAEVYENSRFLADFRGSILDKTKGCVLMEDPKWIKAFSEKHDALNTSNRDGMLQDLGKAPFVNSHGSIPSIPEKNLIYRIAKRTAFFGMGAYG